MESVCLIQRDGLDNVFSHRSFQEYFCALFISNYREADVKDLVAAIANMEHHSNALKMLFEIAPEVVEYEWIIPLLEDFLAKFEPVNLEEEEGLERIFADVCSEMAVRVGSNRINSIGWTAEASSSEGSVGKWMSAVEDTTHRTVELLSALFLSDLWDDWDQFQMSIPAKIRDEVFLSNRRRRHGHQTNTSLNIRLLPSDASWLIYSKLPKLFDDILTSARNYRDEIIRRRNNRRQSVSKLLNKPRGM